MRLSDLKTLINVKHEVIRDGEFNQLGMGTSVFSNSGVLSFLENSKYENNIKVNINISSVITTKEMIQSLLATNFGIVCCDNPRLFFYLLHNKLAESGFYHKPFENIISSTATISNQALIGGHSIKIGKGSLIEPGVIIHPGTIIGENVIIRSGSIISSNGFQFLKEGKTMLGVNSAGIVVLEDFVEVQHNCCIDRGVLGGRTILEKYVKLDNFVHIAHDCVIGERTLVTAGVKFGGRTVVGKDCWIGINATISNGITIGSNATVSLGSVVTRNVEEGTTVTGNFAIEHDKFIAFIKTIR